MNQSAISYEPLNGFPICDRLSFLWLACAAALLPFSNGMHIVPLAAWLGPLFMVRFLRTQKPFPGLLVGYLVGAGAFLFQWYAVFVDAGAMFGLYSAVIGLLIFIPYAADRLLRPRIPGLAGTLVLPSAWVAVEYLFHLVFPLGTFFNIAYSQSSALPLLQVMSLAGMWGVSFLLVWFASVTNDLWEKRFNLRESPAVLLYAAVLTAALIYGGLRLAYTPLAEKTVQVSALVTNINQEVDPEVDSPMDQRMMAGTMTEADRQELTRRMEAINSDLLARTRTQARAGSKIITWTEYNAHVWKDEEEGFLAQTQQLAREEHIYLVFPLITIQPDPARREGPSLVWENKSVMITPEGEIAYQYLKHNLLIGPEAERAVRGPGGIQVVDSPYGKLSSVICLDMDYPNFMRMAGQQDVDILLSGAIDGTASSHGNPLHSVMAAYRAIESGFSLARGGFYGQTYAVDYLGRTLGSINYYSAGDRTLAARLPVRGVRTVYTVLGDFLPWLCIAMLLATVGYALVTRHLSVHYGTRFSVLFSE